MHVSWSLQPSACEPNEDSFGKGNYRRKAKGQISFRIQLWKQKTFHVGVRSWCQKYMEKKTTPVSVERPKDYTLPCNKYVTLGMQTVNTVWKENAFDNCCVETHRSGKGSTTEWVKRPSDPALGCPNPLTLAVRWSFGSLPHRQSYSFSEEKDSRLFHFCRNRKSKPKASNSLLLDAWHHYCCHWKPDGFDGHKKVQHPCEHPGGVVGTTWISRRRGFQCSSLRSF